MGEIDENGYCRCPVSVARSPIGLSLSFDFGDYAAFSGWAFCWDLAQASGVTSLIYRLVSVGSG